MLRAFTGLVNGSAYLGLSIGSGDSCLILHRNESKFISAGGIGARTVVGTSYWTYQNDSKRNP